MSLEIIHTTEIQLFSIFILIGCPLRRRILLISAVRGGVRRGPTERRRGNNVLFFVLVGWILVLQPMELRRSLVVRK